MYCHRCGASLEEGAIYCHRCGANVAEALRRIESEKQGRTEKTVRTNSRRIVIAISVAVVLVALIIILAVVLFKPASKEVVTNKDFKTPENKIKNDLETPTSSATSLEQYAEIEKNVFAEEEQLKQLLGAFYSFRTVGSVANGEYDYRDHDKKIDLMIQLLFPITVYPQGYYSDLNMDERRVEESLYESPENDVKWIAEQVFNVSTEDFDEFKNGVISNQYKGKMPADSWNISYRDNSFYCTASGLGGTGRVDTVLDNVTEVAGKWYVQYHLEFYMGSGDEPYDMGLPNYAVLTLKSIAGKQYWSLYYKSNSGFEAFEN